MNLINNLNTLLPLAQVNTLVRAGRVLVVAGEEQVLQQIEKGNWVGGTIPYFMDKNGGCVDREQVFVTDLTDTIQQFAIKQYTAAQLESMPKDRYSDGFSYVLMPAFTETHSKYALELRYLPELFDVVTMGWVSGVHLGDLGKVTPKVINGTTGAILEDALLALHCQLPAHQYADIEIVNLFEQADSNTVFTFPTDSFTAGDCLINGTAGNLAQYLLDNQIDTTLPLIADHGGAIINAAINQLDEKAKTVSFFGPILSTQEYKLAKFTNRNQVFADKIPSNVSDVICSCNCIVNYNTLHLEGQKTSTLTYPFTFGEIAYILVNQTMVLLSVKER